MKKPTFSKAAYAVLFLFLSFASVGQNFVMPTIRKNLELKGNMLVIGNNILGKSSSGALNDLSVNETTPMVNIDIDGDPNTLNSSSADLKVPSTTTCFRIAYAGLYWGSILQSGSRADINKVKLKLPGSSSYTQINGTLIYDANVAPIDPDNNKPYACYADVTSLLTGLSNPQGTYTVADVVTNTGYNGLTGLAAGWTLYVVYEDPQATTKSFTSFDGFSALYDGKTLPIKINGFLTAPTGTINLKFGFASLNGDKTANGSKVEVSNPPANGTAIITAERPSNTFFNSSITDINGYQNSRNPNGTNSIGYDTGIEELLDVNKSTVDHNSTSATITLQVAKGQANPIFTFFNCFSVDVIAPDIQLTKIVKNGSNVDIGGSNVVLGDNLFYEISYKNIGNDNVTGIAPNAKMIVKDILPKNVILNYPADPSSIDLSYSGGATVKSYDPITRTIIFEVPDAAVKVGLPNPYMIRLKVQVVPDCNMLVDACSNEIKNQAFASYTGYINKTPIVEEGSFASTVCNFGTGTSTNFLVNIDNCKFTKKVVLCNTSVILTAPNGYDSYVWSKTLGGSSIGTGSTYTATQTGTYYVHATSLSTCLPIDQEITVVPFGNTVTNPVIPYAQSPYAGSVTTCTINGKLLPNLFLCGANDFRDIKTGITDATSIIWEKLNENSTTCKAADSNTICANESASCSWSQVGTGPDYKANTAGQFRLTINYTGGCFSVFYFNVFQNLLNPTVVSKDITCNTKGEITVKGIPESGYEYSLDNGGTGTYQASNVFNNVSAGFHDVYVRQIGVVNGCLFKVLGVYIQNRVYQVGVNVVQPLCNGGKGSVTLQANNVLPQYYYSISQGATVVNSAGPINVSNFTFSNLNPGTYTVRVWTDDGCDYSQDITINDPPLFTATAVLTTPLTCTDGLITVNTFNGTGPYKYYVNSTTSFQNTNQITVSNPLPAGGIYNIDVTDSKGCLAKTSITVVATPAPVHTITTTNVLCYGDTSGVIQFNVTSNAGNYALSYSIDGGTTYSNNPVFSNLVANTVYTPKIRYTLDGVNYCYDTKPSVTLTGPTSAVTASAGVSELAGCGPAGEGKIRITNPQGGIAPYQYSFDNQGTWITSNEAYKMPGTYTVYIKDANDCIFAMPNIIIDPKPVAPTIDVASPVFNCNGTANTTATITNPGSANYQYGYLLDGNANTNVPSNVFVNIPSGSHTVSVTYNLVSVPTYSNLLNEDFGSGSPTTTSGIASAYCFNDQHVASPWACGTRSVEDNQYSVASFFWRSDDTSSSPAWYHYKDHTSNGTNTNGRYLLVNIGSAAGNYGVLYSKPIVDVIPNQPVKVDLYLGNLLRSYMTNADCDFIIELVDPAGVVVASQSTGVIPKNETWNLKSLSLNPGPNTSLTFKIRSGSIAYNGNDAVIDDIRVYQLPKSCITQVDFPFEVPTGKAFSGSVTGFKDITCAGANNGEFTIAVQNFDIAYGFDYSINGGTTWVHQTVSPFTITGLAANTYTPLLRYNAAGACPLTLTPVTIKAPTALTVDASVTTQATCTTGATITASASGGTPAYEFELRQSDGVTPVPGFGFSNNSVFTNVPAGTTSTIYTVFAKDANGCITSVGKAVNVVAPTPPTASFEPSNLCFDPNAGVNIVVKVTGGLAPYTYTTTFNGGTPSAASATFAGPTFTYNATVSGTYSFDVYDANNCKATTINQVINDKLTVVTPVTTALDCDVAPANQAVVTGTISVGTAPFTVTLTSGTGGTLTQPVGNGNTFTYNNTTGGTYGFQVKDANNCLATSSATINPLIPITLTSTYVNPKCNGNSDGSIQLNPSGGSGGFTYSNDGGVTYNNISFYNGLSAGTYTFYVKDTNKCTQSITVTLTPPASISAVASMTPYTCDNPAVISITSILGGSGTYNYTLNRGVTVVASNTTGVFNNISVAGSYTVTVTDSNGCTFTTTPVLNIVALNPPTNPTFSERPISCKSGELTSDVTVSIAPGTGTGSLKYEITAPASAISNTTGATDGKFTGLTPGNYTFKVTDANNCSVTGVFKVNDVLPVAVNGSVVSNISCLTSVDGKLNFTVSGNSGTFTYVLKNSAGAIVPNSQSMQTGNVIDFTGLAAETYTITITNPTTGCTAAKLLKVAAPTSALDLDQTTIVDETCNAKGSASINAKGGWGSYTYTVTPTNPAGATITQNNKIFGNLSAGDYSFTVTDLNGCQVTGTFHIGTVALPSASIDLTASDLCYDSVGKATIVVKPTAPSPSYMYNINNGSYQSGGTFNNLNPGNYTVNVKDTNTGCILPLSVVTIESELKLNVSLNKSANCTGQNAEIKGTITGGKAPYTYTVTVNGILDPTVRNSSTTTFTYSDSVATNASVNTVYSFTLTDASANKCSITSDITVAPKTNPEFTAIPNSTIFCNGEATGSITVTIDPTKGVGPYIIDVVNTTTGTSYGTKTSGLPAGNYTIKVTDANGCPTVKTGVIIDEPKKIEFKEEVEPMTCDGAGLSYGSISVTKFVGGSRDSAPLGPFTYTLTNNIGEPTQVAPHATSDTRGDYKFTVLKFGIYELSVSDANGCTVTKIIKMASPPEDLDIKVTSGAASCTSSGLVVTATPVVPGGPYHFAKYPIDPANPNDYDYLTYSAFYQDADAGSPLQSTFNGLNPGVTYSFIVYDETTKCYYFKQADAPTKTASTLTSTVTPKNVTCHGAGNGSVSFTFANTDPLTTQVKYEIFNSQTNQLLTPSLTGTVALPSNSKNNIGPLATGTYYILFTEQDAGGALVCMNSSKSFTISESVNDLKLTANAVKKDNCKSDQGVIEAFASGGTVIEADPANGITAIPYLYQIYPDTGLVGYDPSDLTSSDPNPLDESTFTTPFSIAAHTSNTFNVEAGNYLVYVRDAYGCIQVVPVTVDEDPEPKITALVNNACADEGSFAIDVNLTTSGVGTHYYSLDNTGFIVMPATPFTIPNLSSGSHSVEVKDFNGCGMKVTLPIISTPLDLTASFTTQPSCKNTDGVITALVTGGGGGTPNQFEYTLKNNSAVVSDVVQLDNGVFIDQAAGNYTVTVKDLKTLCTKSTTVDLLIPTDVVLTNADISITQVDCNAAQGTNNNGTITVNLRAVNDNPPYTYTLTPTAPAGSATTQPTNVFSGLTPGNYDVTVTSGRSCVSAPVSVTIAIPAAVTASASAPAFSCTVDPIKTVVTVVGGGGTGIYAFSKDGINYFASNSAPADNKYAFDLLDDGTTQNPTYWVKDSNGCIQSTTLPAPINPLPKLISVVANNVGAMDCLNNQQQMNVTITGGSNTPNAFTYNVYQDGIVIAGPIPVAGNTFTYNAPTAGHYYEFEVFDNNTMCSLKSTSYNVPIFNTIKVIASTATNVSCDGGNNGSIEINITGYSGPYNYKVLANGSPVSGISGSGNTSTNPFVIPFGLTAGTNYTVEITETAFPSCITTSNVVVITEPTVLDLSPVITVVNQNCKTAGVVITVPSSSVTGGTPGYTYAFVSSGTPPTATDFTFSNTRTIPTTKISPAFDVIDVWVQDVNGCTDMVQVHISKDPLPTITNVVPTTQCPNVAGTYDITVTANGVGTLEYSLDGNGWQISNILTVNSPGNYPVYVRDVNQCTTTAAAPVTILKPIALRADVTKLPTCNINDGEITLTATDGSGNYEYSIGTGAYGSSNVFAGLGAGAYTMNVRDITTTCVKSLQVIIDPPTAVTGMTLAKTDVSCKGGSDGSIKVSLDASTLTVNNNPPYTYSIDNGVTYQASNIFTGLIAGSYAIIVKSSRGCTDTKTIQVGEPANIVVPTPVVVEFGCTAGSNAMNFATITVNGVAGGSGTYSIYEFFKNNVSVQRGSSNVYTETDLAGGSYTVTVYDDKGCSGSTLAPITITPFIPMDKINVVVNQAIDCNNPENIAVTAVDASGVAIPGVQYTLVDKNATTGVIGGVYPSQTNSNGIFTGLPVGNYIITATNPGTGCSIQDVHYVNEPNTFDLTIDNIVDVTCFGGANGGANVTIVDRTMPDQAGPFSYTLLAPNGTTTTGNSATAGPLTLNGLVAGNYTITATLTNNPFCSVTKVFTISQPNAALRINETHTPITCVGNDGTISATAIGGWSGGYEFALAGPVNVAYSVQSDFTNLTAGLYTVSVRDSKRCVDQVQVTLVNPTPIAAAIVVDKPMLACSGDTNATITVQQPVTGGSGVYKYTLEATYANGTVTLNGPQTSNVFTNLGVGSYKVIVSDTWNCSVNTNTVVINQPTEVTANLVKATAQTCLSPATLTLSATGGTGTYSYSADPNFATVLGSFASSVTITVPFTTVPANYVYYVKDANGCSNAVSNAIDVIPLEPLDFTFENNNPFINCLGDNDGEIIAVAKGGSGNYVYTLLDGSGIALATAPTQLTPGHFTQLPAGNYTLLVTSGDCTLRKTITITQPNTALTYTAAVTNVTCNGNGDGKVVLVGSGGTGVIKYAISPDLDKFLDNGTFLNLVVGHYQAIIQDVNGCNHIYDFDITEPAPISVIVDPLSIKQELCSGEKTGEFAITITGGTAPYSTSIDKDPFIPNRVSFTGLSGGKHTVIVKDANLCEFTYDELLNPAVTLDPKTDTSYDCVNNSSANKVTVHIDDSNNPADVTYSLDSTGTPQSSNVFTNLAPGNHFVMVQHKNGCVDATAPFTIDQVDPLKISIALGGLNEIVATVTGGSGVYQFTVNGESIGSNNKYIYFHSGDYTVTVTDSYGCSVSATKYFEFIDITIPPIFTPNGDGNNDNWKPTNTENYPDIKFIVYDRYGRQVGVFGAGQSWDGKYNGTELPMGDYWYILKLRHAQDDREFVGHFTLYR